MFFFFWFSLFAGLVHVLSWVTCLLSLTMVHWLVLVMSAVEGSLKGVFWWLSRSCMVARSVASDGLEMWV